MDHTLQFDCVSASRNLDLYYSTNSVLCHAKINGLGDILIVQAVAAAEVMIPFVLDGNQAALYRAVAVFKDLIEEQRFFKAETRLLRRESDRKLVESASGLSSDTERQDVAVQREVFAAYSADRLGERPEIQADRKADPKEVELVSVGFIF